MPLQPQALEDVKAVVRKHITDGIVGDGITERGLLKDFLNLCVEVTRKKCSEFNLIQSSSLFQMFQGFFSCTRYLFKEVVTKLRGQFYESLVMTTIFS